MLGSTFDFDMDGEARIKLLNDLMLVAKETNAWVITLGLNAGLARFVGEAKSTCEATCVPLIGVCPWGLVEGRQALWDEEADRRLLPMTEKNTVENFEAHEKQFCSLKPPKIQSAPLNRQHTHFVFIDDGKEVLCSLLLVICIVYFIRWHSYRKSI
jgi:hypothetical protein